MKDKLYKLWNKQICYEIYFRPLPDTSKVEVITYHNGDPFVNPRSKRKDNDDGNTEIWDIQEARDNWNMWVEYGGYEVSEVEDYLQGGRTNSNGESINYRKATKEQKANWIGIANEYDRQRLKKERVVKKAMAHYKKVMRMIKE